MIARVEPLTTARALRGPFDYQVGPDQEVAVGTLLRVPFAGRKLTAVVVELSEHSDVAAERLAEPEEVIGWVPAHLVELGRWTAREYVSTPARGLGLVLPPGTARSGSALRARTVLEVELTDAGREAAGNGGRLGTRQRAALEALAAGPLAVTELAAVGADHGVARRLEDRGLVEIREQQSRRAPRSVSAGAEAEDVELDGDQRRALDALVATLRATNEPEATAPEPLLLHGVTGSGKTEVYLAAADEALALGRGVLVLVPEIGLTPQTVARFRRRFGERIALLHSRLAPGARRDEWHRLRDGDATVCVGPRSAVFAPVENLGLIIVDEEHDPSFKQESDPRYDARLVARRRAEIEGAVLVAGTATPRPESWHALTRLSLPNRVDGRPMPPVEVLDMRDHDSRDGPLHPRAVHALTEVREQATKAIVMINRRGWSAFVTCRSCGDAVMCPNCDVTLVLHRGRGRLSCHHCGHGQPEPQTCPACGSAAIARHGAGTERLDAELGELLDPLPVFRLDADTTGGREGADAEILQAFGSAASGLLIGTQMVGKGHDFPDVTLSVMLDADAALRFPDFRSDERTFALVAQLAGRSGRGGQDGRVLVQTLAPDARPIRHAARHDAPGFLEGELARREALGYPPFGNLVRIICSSPEPQPAHRACNAVAERLKAGGGLRLLGPTPLFRRQGRERHQLQVRSPDRALLIARVRDAVEGAASARQLAGASISVDVDPQ
ncbi:MAG: replication restart helicase PriA [Solirubrobacterales bacterium]